MSRGSFLAMLSPAQSRAFEEINRVWSAGNVFVVWAATGLGKTTILRALHKQHRGAYLSAKNLVDAARGEHPLALEDAFEKLVMGALKKNAAVFIDDFHLLDALLTGQDGWQYPRRTWVLAHLNALVTYAAANKKRLVFAHENIPPAPIRLRAFLAGVKDLGVEDYQHIVQSFLGSKLKLDFQKLHRFASRLNAHQLRIASADLSLSKAPITTDSFIEYVRSRRMASNVDLGEVQAVDLHDLKGIDDLIEELEAKIVLPLENDELITELGIKPKRGVLIAGPPGTGKTTIGRALAHRLKSKFFLVDGTFISGTRAFYERIQRVFEAAKQNAPAIIFIDDSDVIFESGQETGLYRYLLTMLDGLESENIGQVCVMMTAMNVGNLPPALVRSGRIELWLETRLPDATARTQIIRDRTADLPSVMGELDAEKISAATEGFTGADLKQLAEDGKILYAYDRSKKRELKSITDYFLSSVTTVKNNRERYAAAEASARAQRPQRPPWFDMGPMPDDCA